MRRRLTILAWRTVEGARLALDAIRVDRVRASLTILGVAIGVAVVIAMASAITGINRGITSVLETGGPKTFYVARYFIGGLVVSGDADETPPWRRNPALTADDAEFIRRLPRVRDVSVDENTTGPVTGGRVAVSSVGIAGYSPSWPLVAGGEILRGRNFTAAEYAAGTRVAVINARLARALFAGGEPLGKRISVFGQPVDVVGVYAEAASLINDADRPRLALPHTTFTKVADYDRGMLTIAVIPAENATALEAQEDVIAALRVRRGLRPNEANDFAIVTQDRLLETYNKLTRVFYLVMIALSSLGLMVGGIGVVAVMTISVTERTREIGVRKALGATRGDILFQFLTEAATLTLIGCLAGVGLGTLVAWTIRTLSPVPAAVPLLSVVAAAAASIVTGILFGLYPAGRAARLDPVEALRYE